VDPRAVARQTVVDDRPVAAEALEGGVRTRHARVTGHGDVVGVAAADRQAVTVAFEIDDELAIALVAQHEERCRRRLRAQPVPQLGRG
jgi:hypothetical protein